MGNLYQSDLAAWSVEQSAAIRAAAKERANALIDWENVAEEIEGLGATERRSLESRVGTVIEHRLKLQASPAEQPVRAWRDTVRRSRAEIARILRRSPSLRPALSEIIVEETETARRLVRENLADHGETPLQPLEAVTYDESQVLGDWLPARQARG